MMALLASNRVAVPEVVSVIWKVRWNGVSFCSPADRRSRDMWSDDDEVQGQPSSSSTSTVPRRSTEQTRIGASVTLEGELTCEEDLRLDGHLKGTVSVPQHRVLISSTGKVRANVFARVIEVEGQVRGDLQGAERVVVKSTGNVVGNLRAPRVSLENGAQFKGAIDMEQANSSEEAGAASRKGPRQSSVASSPTPPKSSATVS